MKIGDLVRSKSCGELGVVIERHMTPSRGWVHVVMVPHSRYTRSWTSRHFYGSDLEMVNESR